MNLHLTDEQASLVTIRLALMIEEDEKSFHGRRNPYWNKELDACKALMRELKDFPYGEGRRAS